MSIPGMLAVLLLAGAEPGGGAAGKILFRDAAQDWGVLFHHRHGGSGQRYLVETMVGGVVIFDYDGDGDDDIFFVDGGVLPGYEGPKPRSLLLRNDGAGRPGGRFVDVTERAGIHGPGYGSGAVAGDADGDGDLDLYVTAFGPNLLLSNDGQGSFRDLTEEAQVGETRWSTGAAFSDIDLDGDLDLYVGNYVDFTLANHRNCGPSGLYTYCDPEVYPGVPDRLFRNRGHGIFDDVTAASGIAEVTASRTLGLAFADFDNDSKPDLYVANDVTANFVFRGHGDATFEDLSLLSGAVYGDRGRPEAGMGVAFGDIDGNGFLDIVVTNFELETNAVYTNLGDMLFADDRYSTKLAQPSLLKLTFGVAFADFDNDGDEDLAFANGHVNDNAAELDSVTPYRQKNQVFENRGGHFYELPDPGLDTVSASRGLAVGDLDGDGDPDLVIVNSGELAEVYENLGGQELGFIQVDLVGTAGNRFGVGARLELDAGGAREIREVTTGGSYLSQSSLTAHFGTGTAAPGRLYVHWPSGRAQVLTNPPARRRLRFLEEPAPRGRHLKSSFGGPAD